MSDLENPFWDFSLQIYNKAYVEETLLLLQERHHLDVNLLLLCCWLGGKGVRLSSDALQELDELTQGWRLQVVLKLRAIRRLLKSEFLVAGDATGMQAYQQIKQAELAAEKTVQTILFRRLETLPGIDARKAERSGVMRANLLTLCDVQGGTVDSSIIAPLFERLIQASRDNFEISTCDKRVR